jgi:hypothetical protein
MFDDGTTRRMPRSSSTTTKPSVFTEASRASRHGMFFRRTVIDPFTSGATTMLAPEILAIVSITFWMSVFSNAK